MARPTMYEFAGGDAAFLELAAAHHRRCLEDPVLNHPFSHPDALPDHVERLAAYWAEVFGGPPAYSASFGGQSAMLGIHAGEPVDDDLGDRFLACFLRAIDDAGLPDDVDLRAGLRSYMEWAVEDVLAYSPRGSRVPEGLPVPRWGWNGLE